MKGRFRKRLYNNWGQFWLDLRFPLKHRHTLRSGLISHAFRERLMLTVTEVNDCRYCRKFHAHEALKTGLSAAEIRSYLQGNLDHAADEEIPALLYAQHWAENDGYPNEILRQNLYKTYGENKAEAIETILHMIRMGNLLGNLSDYLLYKASFGRFGLSLSEK